MGYNLVVNGVYWEILGVYWGYSPFTNHFLTSWHIQVHVLTSPTDIDFSSWYRGYAIGNPWGRTVSPKVKPPTAGHKKHTGSSGGVDSVEQLPLTWEFGLFALKLLRKETQQKLTSWGFWGVPFWNFWLFFNFAIQVMSFPWVSFQHVQTPPLRLF